MTTRIDLDVYAKDAVRAAILEDMGKGFSESELRDAVEERIYVMADDVCISYADCQQIIDDYDRAVSRDAEEYQGEAEYKAQDWEQAMVAWAYCVARAYLSQAAQEPIQEALDARERVLEVAQGLGFDGDEEAVEVSHDCPHGWAPHDYEEADGVCVWKRLEGECTAVSLDAVGLCFSICWTPSSEAVEG